MMFAYKDVIVNNFINTNYLYDDEMKLWQMSKDDLAIPFFGISFCASILKSSQFIKKNISE